MSKSLFLSLSFLLIVGTNASAGQIKPEGDSNPKCFVGDISTAWDELMNGDYDPVFDDGKSYMEDDILVGVQVDEQGDRLETRLPRCD